MPPTMSSTALTALPILRFAWRFAEELIMVLLSIAVAPPTAIAMPMPFAIFDLFVCIFSPPSLLNSLLVCLPESEILMTDFTAQNF